MDLMRHLAIQIQAHTPRIANLILRQNNTISTRTLKLSLRFLLLIAMMPNIVMLMTRRFPLSNMANGQVLLQNPILQQNQQGHKVLSFKQQQNTHINHQLHQQQKGQQLLEYQQHRDSQHH